MGGFNHYAGLKGSKQIYVGSDASKYNYTDIASAVAAAQNDALILIEPGTYTLTSTLDILKPITLMGMGGANDVIITSALTTRTVMVNMPATGAAAAQTFKFRNIKFANSSSGDAIEIDNDGGLAQDMYLDFQDCSFISTSGVAMDLDQTTATKDIFCVVSGSVALNYIGASNIALSKAGSVFTVDNMECGVFTIGTANVAAIFNMLHCAYISQAQTSGGSASLLTNHIGNTYYTAAGLASTATGGAANDFDATAGTEFFAGHAITLT